MKLLLDSHAFLWWLTEDPKLSSKARQAVADPAATVYISAATLPRHHDDPFDRMLIAQTRIESLTVVTRAPAFRDCGLDIVSP